MIVGEILSGSNILQRAEQIETNTSYAEKGSGQKIGEVAQTTTKNLDKKEVNKIIEDINDFLESTKTKLKYNFHDQLDEYYVAILNAKTDEVIKEIPPKKLLDIYAGMAEFIGFIVDEKV